MLTISIEVIIIITTTIMMIIIITTIIIIIIIMVIKIIMIIIMIIVIIIIVIMIIIIIIMIIVIIIIMTMKIVEAINIITMVRKMILIQITMEVIIIIILYSCHNKLKCFIFLFFHLDQLSYDWCQHFWFYSIRFNFICFILLISLWSFCSVLFMISEMVKQVKENNVFVKKYENNNELMWRLKEKMEKKIRLTAK